MKILSLPLFFLLLSYPLARATSFRCHRNDSVGSQLLEAILKKNRIEFKVGQKEKQKSKWTREALLERSQRRTDAETEEFIGKDRAGQKLAFYLPKSQEKKGLFIARYSRRPLPFAADNEDDSEAFLCEFAKTK
jgi:hypothetical protein